MSFASNNFVFLFFPLFAIAIIGAQLWLKSVRLAFAVLFAASTIYYALWGIPDLALILASILANYLLGLAIESRRGSGAKRILVLGTAGNLLFLGYFKYKSFFLANMAAFGLGGQTFLSTALPLGVSFYTLQKIAYLADIASGQKAERSLPRFALFVFFFPQLIAGPIVTMRELLPQLTLDGLRRAARRMPALAPAGFLWFAAGLFKKAVIADNMALIADPLFAKAGLISLSFQEAWLAAFSYGLQLYFDFSGYCDMAVGIALIAGIRLPMNFHAPYRALSIRDFWRRWHMTLSRLMLRFLYIPFGGNRHGKAVQVAAVMGTMLISGLWHGANWTFVIWGGYHGALLAAQALWSGARFAGRVPAAVSRLLTLLSVMLGWMFFRSETVPGAISLIKAALDLGSASRGLGAFAAQEWKSVLFVAAVLAATQMLPAMQDFLSRSWQRQFARRVRALPGLSAYPAQGIMVRSSPAWAMTVSAVFALAFWQLGSYSPFIYFQF
jgi:D-alanyl-lipoteichoic acid acyltransferase DltB (MBOAT superfamily)